MANQVDPATIGGTASRGATAQGQVMAEQGASAAHIGEAGQAAVALPGNVAVGPYPSFHGRRISWIAVSVVMAGFLIGGLSLVFGHHGPTWWLFWTGGGVAVLGVLMTVVTNTFQDWY
jgi:hypothetical protein